MINWYNIQNTNNQILVKGKRGAGKRFTRNKMKGGRNEKLVHTPKNA